MTLYFSPENIRMIGWALLHFVWQGAVVAALLSMLLAFTRSASVRYVAAVGALLLMLALPFATLYVMRAPAPAAFADATEDNAASTPVRSTLGPASGRRHLAPTEPESGPETMLWLVRGWMLGVLLFSLRSAGGFLLVQRLRRIATVPASGELLQLCEAVQRRMRIARAVRFCRCATLKVPAVVGGLRPIVLLPITALTGLSDSQIEAIIAHELAHVRRLDYFVNLFQVFAETVLFYHPAVWWVNNRIRVERENCCDDTAIAVCGDRLNYVRALTHLESARITPQFAMGADGSPLKARVRRLLGMSEEKEGIRSGSSVLGVMIVAGLVLAASSMATGAKAQVQQPQSPTPPTAIEPIEIEAEPIPAHPVVAVSPAAPVVDVKRPVVNVSPKLADVNIPPMHVRVPAVNVAVPAMNLHKQLALAIPAIRVAVPAMDMRIPAIRVHAALAQANGTAPSESYIDAMKAAGYGDLDVDQLVAMKIQGITPEYVRGMRAAGMKTDADDLIGMKIQGVTPEYVKEMRAAYPSIDSDTIVAMKIQGVTPQYAAELSKLGIKGDAETLVGLKIQGVSPEYVRDMQATGLHFDSDELIGMKIQGVTPAYVNALKAAGFKNLEADEITGAKIQGITPEFIEKAKSHGFKDLDLDKLIQLKNTGVL